jgi:hypothetical protein
VSTETSTPERSPSEENTTLSHQSRGRSLRDPAVSAIELQRCFKGSTSISVNDMSDARRIRKWSMAVILAVVTTWLGGCIQPEKGISASESEERYPGAETTPVDEPVLFTDVPYDIQGSTSIADLLGSIPEDDFVWYGMSDPYPITGSCDSRNNEVVQVASLPARIEGIATLHPRYFQKVSFCGSDERYYGSFVLEDKTGGILVLKDSKVSDFSMGARVSMRVRGLLKYFDTRAVLVYDEEEIVSSSEPVYFEDIQRSFEKDDVGRVKRVTGKVSTAPTNANFNEICLTAQDDTSAEICAKVCVRDSDCESADCVLPFEAASSGTCSRAGGFWLVSMDKEIGQRLPVVLNPGHIVTLTGPIVDSFGLRMLVSKVGQIQVIDEGP